MTEAGNEGSGWVKDSRWGGGHGASPCAEQHQRHLSFLAFQRRSLFGFFWRQIHFPKVIPSPGTSPQHRVGDVPSSGDIRDSTGPRAGSPRGVALAQPQPPKDIGALFAGLRPFSNFDNSGPASCHGPRIFLEGPPPSPGVVSRSISSSGLML